MRRNICQGKFELWRLFLTDEDSLPVKKMTKNTSYRELRCDIVISDLTGKTEPSLLPKGQNLFIVSKSHLLFFA